MDIRIKEAAPSLGKTYGAVQWMKGSKDRFIVASISLLLCKQTHELVKQQCPNKKVLLITSEDTYVNGVFGRFTEALGEDWDVILISHKCLEMTYKKDLDFKGWRLIIDEVPSDLVEVNAIKQFLKDETTMLTDYVICTGQKLKNGNGTKDIYRLRSGVEKDLGDRLDYLKSSGQKTISNEMKDLYEYLLLGGAIQRWKDETDEKMATYLYIKVISPVELLSTFDSVSLLAANIKETLVGVVWNNIFNVSFVEEPCITLRYDVLPNTDKITIYPLLPESNNMSRYIMDKKGNEEGDIVFEMALSVAKETFKKEPFIYSINTYREKVLSGGEQIPVKAHGLNKYSHINNAAILFSYNPSSDTQEILEDLAEHFKLEKDIFVQGYITTHYFESSFQGCTRLSVRQHNSTTPVKILVGDTRCAKYLIRTWFSDAKIDNSLRLEIFDGRSNNTGRPKKSFPSMFHMDSKERRDFYNMQTRKNIKYSVDSESDKLLVKDWLLNRRKV